MPYRYRVLTKSIPLVQSFDNIRIDVYCDLQQRIGTVSLDHEAELSYYYMRKSSMLNVVLSVGVGLWLRCFARWKYCISETYSGRYRPTKMLYYHKIFMYHHLASNLKT